LFVHGESQTALRGPVEIVYEEGTGKYTD
jgi:hypothetical protein